MRAFKKEERQSYKRKKAKKPPINKEPNLTKKKVKPYSKLWLSSGVLLIGSATIGILSFGFYFKNKENTSVKNVPPSNGANSNSGASTSPSSHLQQSPTSSYAHGTNRRIGRKNPINPSSQLGNGKPSNTSSNAQNSFISPANRVNSNSGASDSPPSYLQQSPTPPYPQGGGGNIGFNNAINPFQFNNDNPSHAQDSPLPSYADFGNSGLGSNNNPNFPNSTFANHAFNDNEYKNESDDDDEIEYLHPYFKALIKKGKKIPLLKNHAMVGLKNTGNSCYINSMLQWISHYFSYVIPGGMKTIVSWPIIYKDNHSSNAKVLKSLSYLIQIIYIKRKDNDTRHAVAKPPLQKLRNALGEINREFKNTSKQEDSVDLLVSLLDAVTLTLLNKAYETKRLELGNIPITIQSFLKIVEKETYQKNFIAKCFDSTVATCFTCKKCGYREIELEKMKSIVVPVVDIFANNKKIKTLEESLQKYEAPLVELNESNAKLYCKIDEEEPKFFDIKRKILQPGLIVSIKLHRKNETTNGRVSHHIAYPLENLQIGGFRYDLIATSIQRGGEYTEGGHYVNYTKDLTGQWWLLDDASPPQKITKQQAKGPIYENDTIMALIYIRKHKTLKKLQKATINPSSEALIGGNMRRYQFYTEKKLTTMLRKTEKRASSIVDEIEQNESLVKRLGQKMYTLVNEALEGLKGVSFQEQINILSNKYRGPSHIENNKMREIRDEHKLLNEQMIKNLQESQTKLKKYAKRLKKFLANEDLKNALLAYKKNPLHYLAKEYRKCYMLKITTQQLLIRTTKNTVDELIEILNQKIIWPKFSKKDKKVYKFEDLHIPLIEVLKELKENLLILLKEETFKEKDIKKKLTKIQYALYEDVIIQFDYKKKEKNYYACLDTIDEILNQLGYFRSDF